MKIENGCDATLSGLDVVPEEAKCPANDVPYDEGNDNEPDGERDGEAAHGVWRRDEVQAENPVDEELACAKGYKQRPAEMPGSHDAAECQSRFVRGNRMGHTRGGKRNTGSIA